MAEIFISYSRKDQDFVFKLHAALEEHGRSAWVDWEGVAPTEKWLASIRSAIDEADAFLFVISPDSVTSEVCRTELDHAVEQHKRLIPVVFRDPDAGSVQRQLSELNYIFARESDSFEDACAMLLTALDTDLEWTRAHTRLLVRAADWNRQARDKSFTLRGRDLSDFEEWLARSPDKEPKPTTLQSEYLLASRRSATRRQQILWGSLAVGLSIAVGLTTVAYFLNRERVRQETIAEARQQVNRADEFRDGSVDAPASRIQLMSSTRYATRALATLHGLGVVSLDADQAVRKSFALLPRWIDTPLGPERIDASGFSTRGAYLALFRGREQLMVWDTVNWQEVGACNESLAAMKSAVAVAAADDGEHAAIAVYNASGESGETEVTVWSIQDCSRKLTVQVPRREDDIALLGNGVYLLVDTGSTIRVWDIAGQNELPSISDDLVDAYSPHPDGRLLATVERGRGQRTFRVRIHDLGTNQVLREWAHADRVRSIRWLGNALVVSDEQSARTYDSNNGELLHTLPVRDEGFAVSPDGRRVALTRPNYVIQIRDTENDIELAETSHGAQVENLAFAPDNQSVITVDATDRSIRKWLFSSGGASIALPKPAPVSQIRFAADSSSIYLATEEGTEAWLLPAPGELAPSVWHTDADETVDLLASYEIEPSTVDSPDAGTGGRTITLRATDTLSEPRTIRLSARTLAAKISRDGDRLAATLATSITRGGHRRSLEIWDTVANTRIAAREFQPMLDRRAAGYMQFAGGDHFVVIGTRMGIVIMDTEGLNTIASPFHRGAVLTAVNAIGSVAASMGLDGVVRIWDIASGNEFARVEAAPGVQALSLSNDRRWLATWEGSGQVRLWALAPDDLIPQACQWVDERCPYVPLQPRRPRIRN